MWAWCRGRVVVGDGGDAAKSLRKGSGKVCSPRHEVRICLPEIKGEKVSNATRLNVGPAQAVIHA